jgi:hypothetical protein
MRLKLLGILDKPRIDLREALSSLAFCACSMARESKNSGPFLETGTR